MSADLRAERDEMHAALAEMTAHVGRIVRAVEACLRFRDVSGVHKVSDEMREQIRRAMDAAASDELFVEWLASVGDDLVVTSPPRRVVLTVNRSDSRCGACNRNADPGELAHTMANMRGEGCGAAFTHITTGYLGAEESVRLRRPDLTWLDFPVTVGGDAR